MIEFTLDTSGEIVLPYPHLHPEPRGYRWTDLSPFVQGYVEAMFASLPLLCHACQGNGEVVTDWDRYLKAQAGDVGDEGVATCPKCDGQERAAYSFSDLAPETLAAILKDCEVISAGGPAGGHEDGDHAWRVRQAGRWPDLPPLALCLGGDGGVRLHASQKTPLTAGEGSREASK